MSIATIGALMGLGFTSGIRLYSTVLALGLGIRFGFIDVPDALADLRVIATTPVIIVAGIAYAIEFLADKIPWVDSAWDVFHTFIRPLGAAILAAVAIGDVDPAFRTVVALLCGTIALSSHSAKAGTRLLANHSPEPFTNIGLSLGEDAFVLGGVWFALAHPIVTLVIVILAVALVIWFVPRLIHLFRRNWLKLRTRFSPHSTGT
jgi:hypothetical protein